MKALFTRLAVVVLLGLALLAYVIPWSNYGVNLPYISKDYKLGLDLQWWVELDYKVFLDKAKAEDPEYSPEKEKQIIEWLKSIIDRRVEALQINDSVITTATYWWEQHIIVQIPLKWKNPEEDKINITRAKEAIGKVLQIAFKERRTSVTDEDRAEREKIAETTLADLSKSEYGFYFTASRTQDNNPDVEIWELTITGEKLANYFEFDQKDLQLWINKKAYEWTGISNLSGVDGKWIININDIKEELQVDSDIIERIYTLDYIFISSEPSAWIIAKDDNWEVLDDRYFKTSWVFLNEASQPNIELVFNDEWGKIFWNLSTRLVGQQMAIFVWGDLLTAPVIQEPITWGRASITWNYTLDSANKLSNDINTWVVPAPIYLTSEKSIDSKLWASSLNQLLVAWSLGFLLIFIFLIVIYRTSGFLASVALLMYVAIILSVIKFLWVTLTLASVAGLILSIGMAIDANILIFERIRDELTAWEKISKAAKIWFKKSWTAIWDSNVTGLIVAIILYIFGINLIKWFGLMLAIGILVSLFSVMWISRILIFVAAKNISSKKQFIWKYK